MAYSFIKNKKGGVSVLLDSAADISNVPVDQFFPGTFAFTADGSAHYRLSTSRTWVEVSNDGGWPKDLPFPSEGGYGYTGADSAIHKIDSKYLPEVGVTPVIEPTSGTATIDPNKFYDFGEQAAIAVTLGDPVPGIVNEYSFEFVSGATPATLSVTPASGTIAWVGGEPTIEASKRYQVSILNNMAVIVGA